LARPPRSFPRDLACGVAHRGHAPSGSFGDWFEERLAGPAGQDRCWKPSSQSDRTDGHRPHRSAGFDRWGGALWLGANFERPPGGGRGRRGCCCPGADHHIRRPDLASARGLGVRPGRQIPTEAAPERWFSVAHLDVTGQVTVDDPLADGRRRVAAGGPSPASALALALEAEGSFHHWGSFDPGVGGRRGSSGLRPPGCSTAIHSYTRDRFRQEIESRPASKGTSWRFYAGVAVHAGGRPASQAPRPGGGVLAVVDQLTRASSFAVAEGRAWEGGPFPQLAFEGIVTVGVGWRETCAGRGGAGAWGRFQRAVTRNQEG